MLTWLKKLWCRVDPFSLLYPNYCWQCTKILQEEGLCSDCLNFALVPPARIFVSEEKYLTVLAVSDYKDPLKGMLVKKLSSDFVASRHLAKIILKKIDLSSLNCDYIVPVPLHIMRYAKRGFNQAEVMAKVIGKELNIPVIKVLKRVKRTAFQSKLTSEQREQNLYGAFALMPGLEYLRDKDVLIVDDLCTTGITLKCTAQCLLGLQPKKMFAVVGCRKVKRQTLYK